jgi:hypothetical protein
MKKLLMILVILVLLISQVQGDAVQAKQATQARQSRVTSARPEVITKTYFLKHISPREVERALRYYFYRASSLPSRKMITVQIPPENVKEFEALLKKMDVPKQTISFRIFTIIASKKPNGGKIDNRDLKNVLSELKNLLNFKSFKLDGVSLLNMEDGSDGGVELSSSISQLKLGIEDVTMTKNQSSNQIIEINELYLRHYKTMLISTRTSIKNNGYLIAGVSRLTETKEAGANADDSLVLVIHAKVKK